MLTFHWLSKILQNSPVWQNKWRLVTIMMTASLCWSVAMALPPLLGWGTFTPELNGMR